MSALIFRDLGLVVKFTLWKVVDEPLMVPVPKLDVEIHGEVEDGD